MCIRDSVKALKKIEENAGLCIYNLGTGHGYRVLDIVKNFEAATGVKSPYTIKPRRPGYIATCYLSLIHICTFRYSGLSQEQKAQYFPQEQVLELYTLLMQHSDLTNPRYSICLLYTSTNKKY